MKKLCCAILGVEKCRTSVVPILGVEWCRSSIVPFCVWKGVKLVLCLFWVWTVEGCRTSIVPILGVDSGKVYN